jgi:hypothetical protein
MASLRVVLLLAAAAFATGVVEKAAQKSQFPHFSIRSLFGLGEDNHVDTHKAKNNIDSHANIVRRMKMKNAGTNKAPPLDLHRTDRYSVYRGQDCSDFDNKVPSKVIEETTVEQCKESCQADDDCTCITYNASARTCNKQRNCYTEYCHSSSLMDTYMVHSSFKLKRSSQAPNGAPEHENRDPADPDHIYGMWGSSPQYSFERSGGRECLDGVTQIEEVSNITHPLTDGGVSVTQCLHLCLNTTGCTCVKYERYYKSICFLSDNCPRPSYNFCTRSAKYDMYILSNSSSE